MALALVAVGGALAVVIARLRAKRERDAARLQVQVGVARAIAQADSFDEAAPNLLAAIARPMGRELAQYWERGDDDRLRCVAHWREEGFDFDAFERASRNLALGPGEGLPGLAWETGRPVWLSDARDAGVYRRGAEAEEADLHGGLAFPVIRREDSIGVIEVLSHAIRERDPEFYALTEALGRQIGEFLEALHTEEQREEASGQLEAILRGVADAVTAQAPMAGSCSPTRRPPRRWGSRRRRS